MGYKNKTTQEQFEKQVYEKYNGKISVIGKYTGYYDPIELYCNIHKKPFIKKANCVTQEDCCPDCIKEKFNKIFDNKRGTYNYTTESYIEDLKQRNADVTPIEEYKGHKTPILHECKLCGNHLMLAPNKVKTFTRLNLALCQKCSGIKLYVGKNDLWTTDPDIAKMLKNPEEGYQLTRRSDKKTDWICPDCGCEIKQKTVNNTTMNGLVCPLCGNTRSLGHRIVNAILTELGIGFINEKSFYWGNGKSYDIYIESMNCIIEVNGIQHYEEGGFNAMGGMTLEQEIANDKYKKDLAITNGIEHYIYIDSRKSDIDFIIQSIKNNHDFNNIFNIENISWTNVINTSSTSDVITIRDMYNQGKTVPEIQNVVHLSDTVIQRKLHALTEYGLCDYKGSEECFKPVVCLNTKEEFNNLQEAGKAYNIDPNGISFCCRGLRNRRTAGKLEDGTKLTWLFKEDYESKTEDEIQEVIKKSVVKPVGSKKVICLNTKEIFDSLKQAQHKYSDAKSISDCCRHIARSSGIHPVTKEKLKWRYYNEYINLSEQEILNILEDKYYNDKRVICLNTLEIFENATIAGEWCGVKRSGISNCVRGHNITNGKHPITGEPLRWQKYRDYLESTASQEVSA